MAVGLLPAGCQSSYPTVTLRPDDHRRPFTATFTRAYWSQDQAGDDQVVLVNDPFDHNSAPSTGDPLNPSKTPPITQLLYIHLQWRTAIFSRGETPVTSNAVLDWYVYGGGSASMIHYTGSGHVSIDAGKAKAVVDIRHAELKLADRFGSLQDPFKSFSVDGSITAINSPGELKHVLGDLASETKR